MIKPYYIDKKTRVKLKKSFTYGWIFSLQRKVWYGWEETRHTYPCIMPNASINEVADQLLWEEKKDNALKNKWLQGKAIGKQIFEA